VSLRWPLLRITAALPWKKLVAELFSSSENGTPRRFYFEQILILPPPVQRYFKLVLKDGSPYVRTARVAHRGTFRGSRTMKWAHIKGVEYFTTAPPGFLWRGKTAFFTAVDIFIKGKGRLVVTILSLVRIVDGTGWQYDQGELLRWLGESVWFPTNFLPSEKLRWEAVDELTARLVFTNLGLEIRYLVTFDSVGHLTQLECKRYMDKNHLETWVGRMSNYQERNDVLIPLTVEASWKLASEEFAYARFTVDKIDYHIAKEWSP
jgi:hypothetical protein